jgi:hypothetical protein
LNLFDGSRVFGKIFCGTCLMEVVLFSKYLDWT